MPHGVSSRTGPPAHRGPRASAHVRSNGIDVSLHIALGTSHRDKKLLDGWSVEEHIHVELNAEDVADSVEHLCDVERVAAEVIETVVHAHLVETEHLLPDIDDRRLLRPGGRPVGRLEKEIHAAPRHRDSLHDPVEISQFGDSLVSITDTH